MEAEVEEERLRKEREAREKQDVMTLGETREQIQLLETKLKILQDEKQQLFLQLKKVVNEDVRKRRESTLVTISLYLVWYNKYTKFETLQISEKCIINILIKEKYITNIFSNIQIWFLANLYHMKRGYL